MSEKREGPGRPEANIDWDKVDQLLMAGCMTTEIAAYFGISTDTFYRRCLSDKNVNFASYSQEKKAKGESLLRKKQFDTAMSGNTVMQIWLGKNRLGQKEQHVESEMGEETKKKFDELLSQLSAMQAKSKDIS